MGLDIYTHLPELQHCPRVGRIQVTDDHVWFDSKRQGVARPAVGTDNGISRSKKGAGFREVGEFPVGKDDDTLQKKTILRGGWSLHGNDYVPSASMIWIRYCGSSAARSSQSRIAGHPV